MFPWPLSHCICLVICYQFTVYRSRKAVDYGGQSRRIRKLKNHLFREIQYKQKYYSEGTDVMWPRLSFVEEDWSKACS